MRIGNLRRWTGVIVEMKLVYDDNWKKCFELVGSFFGYGVRVICLGWLRLDH